MNSQTTPPGFKLHRIRQSHETFLLPFHVIKSLNDEDEQEENDSELEFTQSAQKNELSIPSVEAVTQSTGSKVKKSKVKSVQVFDMHAINRAQNSRHLTRGALSIFKKFADSDEGQRILVEATPKLQKQLQSLKTQYPNCVQFIEYVESFVALALKKKHASFYFPPVLLVGPPGIGKTAIVHAVASLFGVPVRQIDLSSTTAGFIIAGISSQWSDAKSGVVCDILRDNTAANPILILDEIDKVSPYAKHDPLGPLHSLLEPLTAEKFIDEALDIPINASHVLYVATANSIEFLSKPILSRFTVIEIQAMSDDQHAAVTQSIYQWLLQSQACEKLFTRTLSETVIEALRGNSPRLIKSLLRRGLAQAAIRAPAKSKNLLVEANDLVVSKLQPFRNHYYDGNDNFGFVL